MSAAAERIDGLDLLRAAAIFGVVWIHGCDTSVWALRASDLAGAAVPFVRARLAAALSRKPFGVRISSLPCCPIPLR